MSDRRAITGHLVDAKNIAVHKAMRLSIDVPAEMGAEIVKLFGWPTMAAPVAVAIARLGEPPQIEAAAEPANGRQHGPWHTLDATLQSVLRCKQPPFWTFLREQGESGVDSEEAAATYVRLACGINTRSALATSKSAEHKWRIIDHQFLAWEKAPQVVG